MSKYQNFNQQQLLICRIEWMDKYQGVKDDPPYSANGDVVGIKYAYEHNNFKKRDGHYYGYFKVPGTGNSRLSIERLGATTVAAEVEHITVIWVSHHPLQTVFFVVGWYRNATVYKYAQDNDNLHRSRTQIQDGCLIPPDSRRLQFPAILHSQSLVRYGDGLNSEIAKDFFKKLDNLMAQNPSVPLHQESEQESGQKSHRAGSGWQNNPEIREKVERAAIDCVTTHYEHQGYVVKSVEQENKGWDLEARKGGSSDVLIEVKGHQHDKINCVLSPNEYGKVTNENFRLAVVTSALEEEPCLRIFQFLSETEEWVCLEGKTVKVHQELRVEARIYEK